MQRTGRCLCGAVRYTAEVHQGFTACHCGMCRRWAGGPALTVGIVSVAWEGEDHIVRYASSEIAERAFCKTCGSSLFYRLLAPGKYHGFTSIAFGTLDDPSGLEMTKEWFIDNKPEGYAFAGERPCISEAEALAMLGA